MKKVAVEEAVVHATPLSRLSRVAAELGDIELLSMLSPGHDEFDCGDLGCRRHLHLLFHDIGEPRPGLVAPDDNMVRAIIDFGRAAQQQILVSCWAGISRSSAAVYIMVCDRNPGFEHAIADELRRRAPLATPNRLMVSTADDLLGRKGRMTGAIERIGRGADAFEGIPYCMPFTWQSG
jgi:predicted protein tyrosine phosphatase